MQNTVDRMCLSARPNVIQRRNVLFHCHDFGACQFLDQRIARHVIRMGMASEEDLDVCELEAQFFNCGANHRHGFFVIAVDQNMPFWSRNQEGTQLFGSHKIHIADDFVSREGLVPVDSRNGITPGTATLARLRPAEGRYQDQ
jgi:hypothetical protein